MNELNNLQKKFPQIKERALIELVHSIHINQDFIGDWNQGEYKSKRLGFLGNLINKIVDNHIKEQEILTGNLVKSQDVLYQWLRELCLDQSISYRALYITRKNIEDIALQFNQNLSELKEFVSQRFNEVSSRQEAYEDFNDIILIWNSNEYYKGLPWVLQIPLLVDEIFRRCASPNMTDDALKRYPQRVVNKILQSHHSQKIPSNFFSLGQLLDLSIKDIETNGEETSEDMNINSDTISVVEWLLKIDVNLQSLQKSGFFCRPHLYVISRTLELASQENRYINPAQKAISECRDFAYIPSATDKNSFVKAVVQETFDFYIRKIKIQQVETQEYNTYTVPTLSNTNQFDTSSSKFSEIFEKETNNPKIGLVLAGGGAKGAYQVGVLKYLSEELNFVPDMIAGTSIGALNGAFLASHQPFNKAVSRLEEIWDDIAIGKINILQRKPILESLRSLSIYDPDPIKELLEEKVTQDALQQGIPLWVTVYLAAQPLPFLNYLEYYLHSFQDEIPQKVEWRSVRDVDADTMYNSILASAAIPLVFPSWNIDSQSYVDGFLGDNIPLKALEKEGCTFAIVIHLDNVETWNRHKFPNQTVIEIRPRLEINKSLLSPLDFSNDYITDLKKRGEEDAKFYLEPIIFTLISNYQRRSLRDRLIQSMPMDFVQ
ncbi:MAG: patatin-like phospholipase family protein [Nostoc sp.]|uniref:patatin-like phospholipase family protein n=1 Tax=Nostoc sp. TaxID=1180 RepID=UPI002FF80C60